MFSRTLMAEEIENSSKPNTLMLNMPLKIVKEMIMSTI